jgi:hypothetical protein
VDEVALAAAIGGAVVGVAGVAASAWLTITPARSPPVTVQGTSAATSLQAKLSPSETEGERKMTKRKVFEYGGLLAGVVLIAFGIGALWLSLDARSTVKDELKREQIVGSPDMSPSAIQAGIDEAGLTGVTAPSCDVADQPIETGGDARCFSQYMRIHALESSGGLTYAQMGRFLAADDPENPAGTSDEAAALTDEEGNPVPNAARNTWVTETSLSTALNLSYMAEQLALFGIVVGIALILTGVGFIVLALGGALRHFEAEAADVEKAALT